jgi:hypothetical protein
MIHPRRFKVLASVAALALCAAAAQAQVRTPRPSQKASVMQTIGVTDVTITYSRPGVKGRRIWGDAPAGAAAGTATLDDARARARDAVIVPYGHVWRTGANEATTFQITDDVLVNGQPLKAGTYSLHTIPGPAEWTIIFNSDPGQWGSFAYDEKKDVLRVKAKPETTADAQEWLAFQIDPTGESSAQVNIRWERLKVPFTVEVRDVKALTLVKLREAVNGAKADDWRTPLQAAGYAFQNNDPSDDAEGWRWLEQSIKVKETFQNETAEAIAAGERALTLAREAKVDAAVADIEKNLAAWRAKK